MRDRCSAQPHSLPMPYTGRTHWWKMRWVDYEELRQEHFNIISRLDSGYCVGDVVYIQYVFHGAYIGGMYRQVISTEQNWMDIRDGFIRLTLAPVDERDVKAAGAAWEGK